MKISWKVGLDYKFQRALGSISLSIGDLNHRILHMGLQIPPLQYQCIWRFKYKAKGPHYKWSFLALRVYTIPPTQVKNHASIRKKIRKLLTLCTQWLLGLELLWFINTKIFLPVIPIQLSQNQPLRLEKNQRNTIIYPTNHTKLQSQRSRKQFKQRALPCFLKWSMKQLPWAPASDKYIIWHLSGDILHLFIKQNRFI